ncbi:MAG: hypothetical protein K2G70_07620 [Turicibacter sp.]|nr:hypothetical protein [Turicibacter sp.]
MLVKELITLLSLNTEVIVKNEFYELKFKVSNLINNAAKDTYKILDMKISNISVVMGRLEVECE